MRDLNEAEVAEIAGGVIANPDGGGCTDPRRTEDKGGFQLPTTSLD